jgi:hypothetical protein
MHVLDAKIIRTISINVRKVSSGFEYFLLIFALRLRLTLKMVGLDAELNSLSNGGTFKGVIGQKRDEGQSEGVWMRSSHPDRHHFFLSDDLPP